MLVVSLLTCGVRGVDNLRRALLALLLVVRFVLVMTMTAHAEEDVRGDDGGSNEASADPTDCAGKMLDRAEIIVEDAPGVEAQAAIGDRPDDASGSIIDQEAGPVHAVDACQERGPGA